MQIKNRFDNSIIFKNDADTMRQTVLDAKSAGISLRGADLGGADLGGADLGWADLGGAYLGWAYLRGADLGGAYLGWAYLRGADLRGADLRGAYLRGADLRGAYLRGAYLGRADLHGADLRGAYLGRAYLGRADLGGADLGATIGVFSFGPIGEAGRIGYAVDSADGVMFALGCFWGNQKEAVAAIRAKYGAKSTYEAQVKLAAKIIVERR